MMKKALTILLTSSGSFAGPSYIECFKKNPENRKIRIICSDVKEQPIIKSKADAFYILPHGNSNKYIDNLIKICKKENIDVVFPGRPPESRPSCESCYS